MVELDQIFLSDVVGGINPKLGVILTTTALGAALGGYYLDPVVGMAAGASAAFLGAGFLIMVSDPAFLDAWQATFLPDLN